MEECLACAGEGGYYDENQDWMFCGECNMTGFVPEHPEECPKCFHMNTFYGREVKDRKCEHCKWEYTVSEIFFDNYFGEND